MTEDLSIERRAGRPLWRAVACLFATLLQLAALPAWAEDDDLPDSTQLEPVAPNTVLPAVARPFGPGESLRFTVQYGFIKAGTAWLEVPEVVDWNGRPSWRLVARAESNGFFDKVYKVRNRIESVWDQDSLFSWRYFEDRHEGHYNANDTLVFSQAEHEVRYKDGRTYPIAPEAQDALSAFYYTRFQALPLGGSITFDYHASRKSLPLEVKVLGRQRVKTPAGRFDCVVIEPVLNAGGIFKNKGRLLIWLTDDDRRMPVLMKSKVLIGSIKVVLQEAKPGT
jgi:Protein of unknown function (DUF3108)